MCCSPAEIQQLKHVTLEPRIHKKQQVERLAAPQILVLGGVPSALHQSLFNKICALPHLQSLSLAVNAEVCPSQAMWPQLTCVRGGAILSSMEPVRPLTGRISRPAPAVV